MKFIFLLDSLNEIKLKKYTKISLEKIAVFK
jgi:hypothetical protein